MPEPEPEMELDVGRAARPGRHTRSRRSRTGVEATGPLRNRTYCSPAQSVRCELGVAVIGVVARAFGDDVEVEMVLQVAADARQVVHDRNADRPQMIGRADAGLQQQLRRADGAGRDEHLALARGSLACPLPSTISTPTARPFSTTIRVTARAGPHRQVRAVADRAEIGDRGGGAAARCAASAGSSRRLPAARR